LHRTYDYTEKERKRLLVVEEIGMLQKPDQPMRSFGGEMPEAS